MALVLVVGGGIGLGAAWFTARPDTEPTSAEAPATPAPSPASVSPSTPTATATTVASAGTARALVLAISVDGLNPDALDILGRSGTPSFHRLIDEGASTLNARNSVERTITLPNHAGMLTGRQVDGADGHSVTFNSDTGGTLQTTHGSYVPGMFDVAHDNGLSTAFLAEKDKFDFLIRSWDGAHGAADVTGEDDGRDKTDVDLVADDAAVMDRLADLLHQQQADLVFVHLAAPDAAGHASGWLSDAYLDAVRNVDDDLGRVLDLVDGQPQLAQRLTLLLTADHGGPRGAKDHSNASLLANSRIPFIAWGSGVAPGADLYDLNAGRTDPGTGRPDYDDPLPIRNLDLEGTALAALGQPPLTGTVSAQWPPLRLR